MTEEIFDLILPICCEDLEQEAIEHIHVVIGVIRGVITTNIVFNLKPFPIDGVPSVGQQPTKYYQHLVESVIHRFINRRNTMILMGTRNYNNNI